MNDRSEGRFLKRSFGLSAGLHIVLLPIVLAFFWNASWGIDTALGQSYAKRELMTITYRHVEHHPAPAAPHPVQVVHLATAPSRLVRRVEIHTPRRARETAPVVASAVQPEVQPVAAVKRPVSRKLTEVAYVPPQPAKVDPVVTAEPAGAVVTPTPTPSPAPVSVPEDKSAHGMDVPPGAWGQSFAHPIVADDTALSDLRTRFPENWHATIEIAEDGHPIHVTIPSDVPDDVRAELEKRLMAMHYVPAECNGLHCAGTLEI